MRLRFAVIALACLAAACGSPASSREDAATTPDASTPRDAAMDDAASAAEDAAAHDAAIGDLARGRALYDTHCTLCHGAAGEGYLADHAPAIANADFLSLATDAFLHAAVYDGRPGTPMSAWGDAHGGPLSDADAWDVTALLRSWASEPLEDVSAIVVSGDVAAGAATYARDCAACHGASGEGATALSLNNAVFQDTVSDGFLVRSVERGRRGTDMPAFEGILSAAEIDDVVAFVRTLRREPEPEWPIEDPPALDALVLNPSAEAPSFTLRDGRYVPAADVHAAMLAGQRMVLLDARASSDWVLGHIPGAAPFPFYAVDTLAEHLPNDGTWIVAYCACPHAASGAVVDQLRERGFASTAVLDEGIYFWRDAGYPMARGRLP